MEVELLNCPPMLTREPLIDRITGIFSRLESYLKLKSAQNLNDSAVLAEDLCKGLLNRLYGYCACVSALTPVHT